MSSVSFAHDLPLSEFANILIAWQKHSGRHNLPWQTSHPYLVWVSEIMLQQTQVSTVLNYYPRFIERFPTVQSLAHANTDDVTALWAGLGYYSRARNLHTAAQQVCDHFNGMFPNTRQELETLKGVGRSTAAAISAFAYQQREAILDGNVKRVLCRLFALFGNPQDKQFERTLWQLAESLLPRNPNDMPAYTQGLMDLGATVCTRSQPKCPICPMQKYCQAHAQGLTLVLPERKPATVVKSMPVVWLCLIHQTRIFLVKRPSSGIWSQLYCPPMFEPTEWTSVLKHLPELGFAIDALHVRPTINHKLTHRAMSITPYILEASHIPDNLPWQGVFYDVQDALALGIPKPLTECLQNLLNHNKQTA